MRTFCTAQVKQRKSLLARHYSACRREVSYKILLLRMIIPNRSFLTYLCEEIKMHTHLFLEQQLLGNFISLFLAKEFFSQSQGEFERGSRTLRRHQVISYDNTLI